MLIQGRTTAHGELFGLEAQLRQDILAQAAGRGLDRLWVEKVCLETRPLDDAYQLAARSDAIADLQGLLDAAPADDALLASLLDDFRPLIDKAPRDLIHVVPVLDEIRKGQVAELVRAVTPDLLAYLAKAE